MAASNRVTTGVIAVVSDSRFDVLAKDATVYNDAGVEDGQRVLLFREHASSGNFLNVYVTTGTLPDAVNTVISTRRNIHYTASTANLDVLLGGEAMDVADRRLRGRSVIINGNSQDNRFVSELLLSLIHI